MIKSAPKPFVVRANTPEARAWWEAIERAAQEIAAWPAWKRAGVTEPKPCDTP